MKSWDKACPIIVGANSTGFAGTNLFTLLTRQGFDAKYNLGNS